MTKYEEDEEGVTVHFDHGQPSVHAKILIGADGYFSRVRKQCLNDGPPMFAVSTHKCPGTLPAPLTCSTFTLRLTDLDRIHDPHQ